MIGFVRGILEESRLGKVIVDVNGFGINVFVSESTREELPSVGNEVKLYTHMVVKEDGMSLFGFVHRDALDLFNLLISVNGVGPKGALSILSVYSVSDIKFLIVTEDSNKLSKAPGIGKKTAERIIIDLKDKVNADEINDLVSEGAVDKALNASAKEAVLALVSLGYDKKQAENAVKNIENPEELDTNQILKLALKYIY